MEIVYRREQEAKRVRTRLARPNVLIAESQSATDTEISRLSGGEHGIVGKEVSSRPNHG